MNKRNYEIDRLRGIAGILVIFNHFSRVYFPSLTPNYSAFGTALIDVFAIVSGYLISCITVEKIDALKTDKNTLVTFIKSYYIRRIFRIYPMLLVVFAFVLICSILVSNTNYFATPADTLQAGVYLLTYTYNYYFYSPHYSLALAPCWSLAFEEQFYLLFPFFIIFTKNSRQRVLILFGSLLFVTFIARPITMHYYPVSGLFFSQTRLDSLIYGCLIYYITKQPWYDAIKISGSAYPGLSGLIMIFLTLVLVSIMSLEFSISTAFAIGNLLAFIIVIAAVFDQNIYLFPSYIHKCLTAIGLRVYSLYLIHYPIFLLTKAFCDHWNFSEPLYYRIYAIFALLLTVIATEILYKLVEEPFVEKGRILSVQIVKDKLRKNIDSGINQGSLDTKKQEFA
jgi:peptidoglycan/LPS O-acetylase OafA/YrhL